MGRRKKTINIQLVAQAAGVSLATVSRVVANRTDVSEEMRKRVSAVIGELNFIPTKGPEWRRNLGIVIPMSMPDIGEYSIQVLNGVVRGCNDCGDLDATVILYPIHAAKKSLLSIVRERRCDGLVLCSVDEVRELANPILEAAIPCMFINSTLTGNKCGYINNESYTGAVQAIQHLLGLGHRRIGFLAGSLTDSSNHQERLNAYRDTMAQAGVEVQPTWVVEHHPTQHSPEAGLNQCNQLLDQAPEVTALFCNNDEMAIGVYRACGLRKLVIPRDLSVVSFDDLPNSQFLFPALTTVRQPLLDIGRQAVSALDDFLKGNSESLPSMTLKTELVIRESTSVPNH